MRLPSPYDRLLIPIYIPSFLMAMSNQAMILLLPLYALQVLDSPAYAALVVGFRGLGILLFDVPAGMLVGRFGDKAVLLGGLITHAAVMIVLTVASAEWLVPLLAIPLGGSMAAWFLGRQSFITESSPARERGRAIAVMAGINRSGFLIGPLAGGFVANLYGYPVAFVAGAIFALVAAVIVLLATTNRRSKKAPKETVLAVIGRTLSSNRSFFATSGIVALSIQLMRATQQLLVPLFGTFVGLDVAAIGLIFSLCAALDMSLFYPVGIVMDRWGRKWTGVPSMLFFVLGLLLLPFAQGFYSLLGAGLVLAFANGLSTGIVMIIGMDMAPPDQRAQFLGVWRLLGDLGTVTGPLLAGVLVNIATLGAASFVVAAIGLVGAGTFAFVVPETRDLGID
ncbi:MAG: MFS transporter [Candidatus Rariloculaceae bacterium]